MFENAQPFLVLGVAKSGTTALCRYLEQHPDLCFSTPKEPVFFEAEYERGLDYYREHYFADYAGQSAVGDGRTHNLLLPFVAERIRESLPDAKLVAILRDPIDRAYSHWWHRHSRGLEPLPFQAALEANLARLRAGPVYAGSAGPGRWAAGLVRRNRNTATKDSYLLDLGYYAEQLEHYARVFPRQQLEVVLFEDMTADPEAETRRIWRFLGLDASHSLSHSRPQNVAHDRVVSPMQAKLRRLPRPASLRRLLPQRALSRWRSLISSVPGVAPPLTEESEAWLLEHYAPHNRALEAWLSRKLDSWFAPQPRRTRARTEAKAPPTPATS